MKLPEQVAFPPFFTISFFSFLSIFICFLRVLYNPSSTIGRITVTSLCLFTIALKLVVESKLFSSFKAFSHKESNTQISINGPFLRLSVRITAVINEARYVALLSGVNYCIRFESHEVIMLVFITSVFFGPAMEFSWVYHFSDVFDNEISSKDTETEIFIQSL